MTYKLIITGLGAAGLSMLYHCINSPLHTADILVIDKGMDQKTEKSWCYWSDKPLDIHPAQKEAPTSWKRIKIISDQGILEKHLGQLNYYMVSSTEFYREIWAKVKAYPNITYIQDEITDITSQNNLSTVETVHNGSFKGELIFNSSIFSGLTSSQALLHQSFLGWVIESREAAFDPESVTLMDFRTPTKNNSDFVYILPFGKRKALVEYTQFTREKQLNNALLQKNLHKYIRDTLNIEQYNILRKEQGFIPMTTKGILSKTGPSIIHSGTIGGCTKPATGYTFHNIQLHCKNIVDAIVKNSAGNLKSHFPRKKRFSFYDNILLNIAYKWPEKLPATFFNLFQVNKGEEILRFLHESTDIWQEIALLKKVKFGVYLKSLGNYEKY
ncbi:lycopene cyclase family protein [Cyclobacterium plantarum]|uniref:Lycopene beta cyclase n=1 Tax=Cyclobacterium plantarum TaxID=2716263 RepID=A0ABX0H661_9BACT|nr:lycopene cyclase family protein [Cyclobacterium plantarum]NHE56363.1 Lycopene beta cyclase [Cyclobacterium plantarum]